MAALRAALCRLRPASSCRLVPSAATATAGRRAVRSLAETQLARHVADHLHDALEPATVARLPNFHAFVGAVGYFRGTADSDSDDDDEGVDELDLDLDGDRDSTGDSEAAARFVVCLLGSTLDADAIKPQQVADLILRGSAAEDEATTQRALALALEQLGALSVRRGRVDALHTSSWNYGCFGDQDSLVLFDYDGAVASLGILPGGTPALLPGPRASAVMGVAQSKVGGARVVPSITQSDAAGPVDRNGGPLVEPLPLVHVTAFGVRFPDGPGNVERRQLVATLADGTSRVLLEDLVAPLTADAARVHGCSSDAEQRQLEAIVTTEFLVLTAAQLTAAARRAGSTAQLQLPKLLHEAHNPFAAERTRRWSASLKRESS